MWSKAESLEKPSAVDETSSQIYTYVRRNIKTESRENMGESYTVYVYEERKLTKSEYEDYKRLSDVEDAIAAIIGGAE